MGEASRSWVAGRPPAYSSPTARASGPPAGCPGRWCPPSFPSPRLRWSPPVPRAARTQVRPSKRKKRAPCMVELHPPIDHPGEDRTMTGRGSGRPATTPWGQESAPRCRRFRRIRRLADRDSKGWNGCSGTRRSGVRCRGNRRQAAHHDNPASRPQLPGAASDGELPYHGPERDHGQRRAHGSCANQTPNGEATPSGSSAWQISCVARRICPIEIGAGSAFSLPVPAAPLPEVLSPRVRDLRAHLPLSGGPPHFSSWHPPLEAARSVPPMVLRTSG